MTRFDLTHSRDGVERLNFDVRVRASLEDLAVYLVARSHGMPDLDELTTRKAVLDHCRACIDALGNITPSYVVGDDGLQEEVGLLTTHLERVWAGHGKADLAERLLAKHRKDTI